MPTAGERARPTPSTRLKATRSSPPSRPCFSGKRLRGAVIGGSQILRDFPRYIGLAEAGVLDLGSMVSRRITLDDINEGIDMTRQAEGVRTVVV